MENFSYQMMLPTCRSLSAPQKSASASIVIMQIAALAMGTAAR